MMIIIIYLFFYYYSFPFFSSFVLFSGLNTSLKTKLVMAASNTSETVRVIVRCRPMNQREIDLKCQVR